MYQPPLSCCVTVISFNVRYNFGSSLSNFASHKFYYRIRKSKQSNCVASSHKILYLFVRFFPQNIIDALTIPNRCVDKIGNLNGIEKLWRWMVLFSSRMADNQKWLYAIDRIKYISTAISNAGPHPQHSIVRGADDLGCNPCVLQKWK